LQAPLALPRANRTLIGLAWGTTLLASALPEIIWVQFTSLSYDWLTYAKMGLIVALILVSFAWTTLRPLRNYFIVLLAFFALNLLRLRVNFTLPALQQLFGHSIFDIRMQAEQTGKLAMSAAMITILLALGYSRRQLFLTRGNMTARIKPVPVLGFPKADPWPWFALQWGLYIAIALAVVQYLTLRPTGALMVRVLPILPSILFYAALNAINEELFYRVPALATLEPVAGGFQALWISAYFFGIAHYFGTPGGIIGGILSIFMGWILGKGMLETRGIFWSWWIHFLSDVAIFIFLAVSLLK
jgi:hypothetical protein